MGSSGIVLHRTTSHSWHAFALFVKVELDGEVVGTIRVGESQRYAVTPGSHTMRVNLGLWVWSDRLDVDVSDGRDAQVEFTTTGLRGYPKLLLTSNG